MKPLFLLLLSLFIFSETKSQCFEIESILVDACSNPEDENEIVRFKVGSAALNTANLSVNWATIANSWKGVCQDASTGSKIATLNSTILGCGFLKEPIGGVLPANAKVLLITSTDFNTSSANFSNLMDTMYVIFQCSGTANGGNFGNHTASGTKTLTINFSSPASCSDAVSYNTGLLTQGGTPLDYDGGTVEYTPTGVATYINNGCQAPIIAFTLDAGADKTTCISATQNFTATANGYNTIQWSLAPGALGSLSPTNTLITTYTPGVGEIGTVKLYCTILKSCNSQTITLKDSVLFSILTLPQPVIITQSTSICAGQTTQLSYSLSNAANTGTNSISWKPSNSTAASISVNSTGTYSAVVTNACGASTATIGIIVSPAPPTLAITATPTIICAGQTTTLTVNGGSAPYTWSNSTSTGSVITTQGGLTTVTKSNSCGTSSANITVTSLTVNASIVANPTQGVKPLVVNFTNNSTGATNYSWTFGNGTTSTLPSSIAQTYSVAGNYVVYLTASNGGCMDTYSLIINVMEDEATLTVPNVFTPNGDHANDIFKVNSTNIASFEATIYDRWGLVVFTWNDITQGWDGKTSGKLCVDGTYFYVINAKDFNAKIINTQGSFLLVR